MIIISRIRITIGTQQKWNLIKVDQKYTITIDVI